MRPVMGLQTILTALVAMAILVGLNRFGRHIAVMPAVRTIVVSAIGQTIGTIGDGHLSTVRMKVFGIIAIAGGNTFIRRLISPNSPQFIVVIGRGIRHLGESILRGFVKRIEAIVPIPPTVLG